MTLTLPGPLLLVGAGKMGGALLEGWLERGLDPSLVFIQDPQPPDEVVRLSADKSIVTGEAPDLDAEPAVVLLAVKPQIMDAVLPALKGRIGSGTVCLSIAAGKTLAGMEAHLGLGTAIVRAMPNTPAAIGRGISALYPNANVTDVQRDHCAALLEAAGEVVWLDDEALLDPVTAVSGSGPAYVFLLAECLAEAGEAAGLEPQMAMQLAKATISGAGELMRQSDLPPATLRENVTSPNGTTAAALEVLMSEEGLKDLMTRAVARAAARSQELSV